MSLMIDSVECKLIQLKRQYDKLTGDLLELKNQTKVLKLKLTIKKHQVYLAYLRGVSLDTLSRLFSEEVNTLKHWCWLLNKQYSI